MFEVRRSTIESAGLGLFATRDIKKNEYIGEYKGKLLTIEQFNRKPHHCDYIWEILDDEDNILMYLDGGNKRYSNELRYSNCPCTAEQENLRPIQKGFKMFYYAKRHIKKGEEMMIYYGDDYYKKLTGKESLR